MANVSGNWDNKEPEEPEGSGHKLNITQSLDLLKEAIWSRRPILGEIMKKRGEKNLYEYTKDFLDVNKVKIFKNRSTEILEVVESLLAKRLGSKTAKEVQAQLKKLPLVSTSDHHGPLTHPFFVNSNIISAIPYFENHELDLRYLVNFSFSSISANNSSFPRGISFHSKDDGTGEFIRLPILPDRQKMSVVYALPCFSEDDLSKAKNELQKYVQKDKLLASRAQLIKELLDQYFLKKEVLNSSDFNEQITRINYELWPRFFHSKIDRRHIPDLIYLEIETITKELLIRYHLNDNDSLFYRFFFAAESEYFTKKYFNNIPGAFSLENNSGTYLFWALDDKQHRVKLKLSSSKLISEDGKYSFDWTAKSISQALEQKKIFPAMLLCYLTISLYYGIKCLGGFCQVNDLTLTKFAWQDYLKELGENAESEAINPVQTKELGGDGLVLSYLKSSENTLIPATGIDMVLQKEDTDYERFVELAKTVTLNDTMTALLPEIYKVLYSTEEREPKLQELSEQNILATTGLDKKFLQDIEAHS